MAHRDLSDEQYLVLDLLMRARERGVKMLNRLELLHSSLPQHAALKLTWAALTMPKELVKWVSQHDFTITDEGIQIYNLRFDTPKPTAVADAVICLPGPSAYSQ